MSCNWQGRVRDVDSCIFVKHMTGGVSIGKVMRSMGCFDHHRGVKELQRLNARGNNKILILVFVSYTNMVSVWPCLGS